MFTKPDPDGHTKTQTGTLLAPDTVGKIEHGDASGDQLGGFSLAISGDTIVSSSASHAVGKALDRGEAYVFVKSHSGWSGGHTETAKLTAANGHADDWFGLAVAVSGRTTVVDDKPLSGPRPDGIPIDPANPAGKPRHPDRVKWPSTCTILRTAGRAYADAAALASSEYLG